MNPGLTSDRRIIASALGLVLLALALVALPVHEARVPEIRYTLLSGAPLSSDALLGKVVLVNFWATDCEVCLHEMPRMVEAWRKFSARGYEMVGVAMSHDHPNRVAAYVTSAGLPFPVSLDLDASLARAFGNVRVTPTSFLVDRKGRIVKRILGEPDWPEFHALVEKALADPG